MQDWIKTHSAAVVALAGALGVATGSLGLGTAGVEAGAAGSRRYHRHRRRRGPRVRPGRKRQQQGIALPPQSPLTRPSAALSDCAGQRGNPDPRASRGR